MPIFQLLQCFNLFLILVLGYTTAYLYLSLDKVIMILVFALAIDYIYLSFDHDRKRYIPISACTTGIGVVLMMVASHIWIYPFAIAVGLLQKYLLRIQKKHVFNPSNFALVFSLLFFYEDAHIVLGQLGDERWLVVLVVLLGAVILYHVKRMVIPIVFAIIYFVLQYFLIIHYDPVALVDDLLLRFYSVSFMVFILFMLTDPRTTPERWWMQVLFAFLVAFLATTMDHYYGFRIQHLFLSLFVLSVLWRIEGFHEWSRSDILRYLSLILLVLSAIIYIEMQPPYYFEMEG